METKVMKEEWGRVARVTVILNLGVTETIAWSKGEGPEKGKQGGTISGRAS